MTNMDPLQELYNKFDGTGEGGNRRLAWYGQCRAQGLSHDEAILDTYRKYKSWCEEFWPKRGIDLPTCICRGTLIPTHCPIHNP